MSDAAHLLIPFAYSTDPGCAETLKTLRLPALQRLLARLQPATSDDGSEDSLSPPHERALAAQFGIAAPDGCIPWAAWHLAQSGRDAQGAWAWITPCHWVVAQDHIVMAHPQQLGLSDEDSHALLSAMQAYFLQDGIALEYDNPARWLARGEVFRGFASASLDRVSGRVVDKWLPRGPEARTMRRLQQEMQMLLYTHATNDRRIARGLQPVNSFWVSGTGALPASPSHATPPVQLANELRDPAMQGDWAAWAAAWQQLDAGECMRVLARLDRGEQVALTLCGERNARTFAGAGGGFFGKLAASLRASRTNEVLASL